MPLPAKLGTGDKMYHLSDAGSLAGDISALLSLPSCWHHINFPAAEYKVLLTFKGCSIQRLMSRCGRLRLRGAHALCVRLSLIHI